jgi:NADH-quinone oxidoreductase subunit A
VVRAAQDTLDPEGRANLVKIGKKSGSVAVDTPTRRRVPSNPSHGFVNDFTNPRDPMSGAYLPLLLLFGVSVLNAIGMVVTSHLLNPRRDTPQKLMPYESGMIPLGTTRARFSVKFYMVAISFIVFDLETIFLIPWAVQMRELGWSAFVAMSLFVIVLAVGLVYEWKKGGLEWD